MTEENKIGSNRHSGTTFLSPAKINLFLRVLSKRADGYHEIRSLMQPVSLYDELTIEAREGDSLSVTTDSVDAPGGPQNLAYRAAESLLGTLGVRKSVYIHIKKNIPVGAGLGGGSSNAATVLMALNDMLVADLNEERLMELGAKLGSDVPFFILNGPAIAEGRGEVLRRVDIPQYAYVLINPGFAVSTAWVYNNLSLTKRGEDNILSYSEGSLNDINKLKDALVNDLEEVTLERYPEIATLKKSLTGLGACGALMSGSGPTVFGLFASSNEAKRAFGALVSSRKAGLRHFLVHGISSHGAEG